jgi:hypothetical protein
MPDGRAITADEAAVVRWLLDLALPRYPGFGNVAVAELRVVDECGCGCFSLYLSETQSGNLIAEAVARYPDGHQARLALFGKDGILETLEVIDLGDGHRKPDVSVMEPISGGGY